VRLSICVVHGHRRCGWRWCSARASIQGSGSYAVAELSGIAF